MTRREQRLQPNAGEDLKPRISRIRRIEQEGAEDTEINQEPMFLAASVADTINAQ
jgi:hypothetical protein